MATYTKETALYDTGAIANDIADAGTTATKYITYVDSTNGIRVYDGQPANQNVNFAQINSSGMQIYKGGTAASNKVADFGETVQIGKSGTGHTNIASSGMTIYGSNGTVELANIGYGDGKSDTGTTVTAPYYTLGTRKSNSTVGNYSVAEGIDVTASGYVSYAEGSDTVASGHHSHAEGDHTNATGDFSHSEGRNTFASGIGAHAEGYTSSRTTIDGQSVGNIRATAMGAHAEGSAVDGNQNGTIIAEGVGSHAEGIGNNNILAHGKGSHAEGSGTKATGDYSHAEGFFTEATGESQHVQGKYNIANTSYAFIIGNGTSTAARANALSVDWNGNVRAKGDIYLGCSSDSTGGKKLSSAIGTVKNAYASAKSVATGTNTNLCSVSLEAGTWVVTAGVRFPANATGLRRMNVATTSGSANADVQIPAASGGSTQLAYTVILSPTATTTYYLNCYQNSGSAMSLVAGGGENGLNFIRAIRIL